ncbi:MAG: phosphoglucomutase/phosphomannomutase family protein, partial [Acutalibacteraceae bacterium]|nr:phosphoglucomutase/phosphomannomutase family protein [Acutalibacteraceae bacterium]
LTFAAEKKTGIMKIIYEDKLLPDFGKEIVKVNYEDGCKVYFADDSFVICRFSGTEPLLRIFAESNNSDTAKGYIAAFKKLLSI